jgi:hypothetical protein
LGAHIEKLEASIKMEKAQFILHTTGTHEEKLERKEEKEKAKLEMEVEMKLLDEKRGERKKKSFRETMKEISEETKKLERDQRATAKKGWARVKRLRAKVKDVGRRTKEKHEQLVVSASISGGRKGTLNSPTL